MTEVQDHEKETLVVKRVGADSDTVHPARAPGNRREAVDLDEGFPLHDAGPWPVGMSLRREDLYDDRGR